MHERQQIQVAVDDWQGVARQSADWFELESTALTSRFSPTRLATRTTPQHNRRF